jgi:hypothetical protein
LFTEVNKEQCVSSLNSVSHEILATLHAMWLAQWLRNKLVAAALLRMRFPSADESPTGHLAKRGGGALLCSFHVDGRKALSSEADAQPM